MYDGDQIILDLNGNNSVRTEYGYQADGQAVPYSIKEDSAGGWTGVAVIDPAVGTLLGIANYSGGGLIKQYAPDPWGRQTTVDTGVKVRLRMAGQEYDAETGLYHMGARYYDPDAGRFISEDPLGVRGSFNLYTYAGSNPVLNRDPSGSSTIVATCRTSTTTVTVSGYDIDPIEGTILVWPDGYRETIYQNGTYTHTTNLGCTYSEVGQDDELAIGLPASATNSPGFRPGAAGIVPTNNESARPADQLSCHAALGIVVASALSDYLFFESGGLSGILSLRAAWRLGLKATVGELAGGAYEASAKSFARWDAAHGGWNLLGGFLGENGSGVAVAGGIGGTGELAGGGAHLSDLLSLIPIVGTGKAILDAKSACGY